MATGQQAFGGNTGGVIIEAILTKPPIPVRDVNPALPQGLQEIISKALEKDRSLRYQSAAEILTDLRRRSEKLNRGRAP